MYVDWVRPELLVKNPLWISNNQQNIVNFPNQDFATSSHGNFFQVETGRDLLFQLNHFGETWLPKVEEEDDGCIFHILLSLLFPLI
jgi:hypothetical protein